MQELQSRLAQLEARREQLQQEKQDVAALQVLTAVCAVALSCSCKLAAARCEAQLRLSTIAWCTSLLCRQLHLYPLHIGALLFSCISDHWS